MNDENNGYLLYMDTPKLLPIFNPKNCDQKMLNPKEFDPSNKWPKKPKNAACNPKRSSGGVKNTLDHLIFVS